MKKTKIERLLEAEISRKGKESYCHQNPNACWRSIEAPIRF